MLPSPSSTGRSWLGATRGATTVARIRFTSWSGTMPSARVCAIASPSSILVSQTVKDLTSGAGLTYEDAGEHELKGVPDRWHLYRVVGQ